MIIVIYRSTKLGLNLKISDHVIEADYWTFKGSIATMVDLGTHEFKYLNTVKITFKKLFMNDYEEELYYSGHVCTDTKLLSVILETK